MSTGHTVTPYRYISTIPKAIYSKLSWIQFKVLLAQHQSMALSIMRSHACRTAHLRSQNCGWIVQVNYQEPKQDSQKMQAMYLGLIYKAYKFSIGLFFIEFLNFSKILWYDTQLLCIMPITWGFGSICFSIAEPSWSFHLPASLSHSFSNKYCITDGGVLLYTHYSAMSCSSGNTSIQILNSSNNNFMQNTIISEETWVLTWKSIIYLPVIWQLHFSLL